jgi:hypothetical protein
MSWQVQGHFCRIMRRHDSFVKQLSHKTKKCKIKRLQDNLIVYRKFCNVFRRYSIYAKVYNYISIVYRWYSNVFWKTHQCIFTIFEYIWMYLNVFTIYYQCIWMYVYYVWIYLNVHECIYGIFLLYFNSFEYIWM